MREPGGMTFGTGEILACTETGRKVFVSVYISLTWIPMVARASYCICIGE